MKGTPFHMSVKVPADSSLDLKVRIGLALVESAIDRGLADNARRFEQSLIDNNAPTGSLADLLLDQHERALEFRARAIDDARGWLMALYHERRSIDGAG